MMEYENSKRFRFVRENEITVSMKDDFDEYPPLTMSVPMGEILSNIVWEHSQLIDDKEQKLMGLIKLTEFIRENTDLDKEILIALIDKVDKI